MCSDRSKTIGELLDIFDMDDMDGMDDMDDMDDIEEKDWYYRGNLMTRARSEYLNDLPPFIQENMDCRKGYSIRAFRKSGSYPRPRAWRRELTCRQWDNHGMHSFWTYTDKGVRSIVKAFQHSLTEVAFYKWMGVAATTNPWDQWGWKPILYLPRLSLEFETAFNHLEEFLQVPKAPKGPYKTKKGAEDELEIAQADAVKHEPLEEIVQAAGGGSGNEGHVEAFLPTNKTDDSDEEPLIRSSQRQQADTLVPTQVRPSPFQCSGASATHRSPCFLSPNPAGSLSSPTPTRVNPSTPASVLGVYSAGVETALDGTFLSSSTSAQDQDVTNCLLHERVSAPTAYSVIHDTASKEHPVPALNTENSPFEGVSGPRNTSLSLPAVPAAPTARDDQNNFQPTSMTPGMLNHTTFHIALSSNTFGAVPVKLSSSPTIALFYASIAASWNISEAEIEAISVQFGWLPGTEALVVKREVPDSYGELLEMVEEAPCWADGWMGRRKCSVKVMVHMKEAPVRSHKQKRKDREEEEEDKEDDDSVGLRRRVIKLE